MFLFLHIECILMLSITSADKAYNTIFLSDDHSLLLHCDGTRLVVERYIQSYIIPVEKSGIIKVMEQSDCISD